MKLVRLPVVLSTILWVLCLLLLFSKVFAQEDPVRYVVTLYSASEPLDDPDLVLETGRFVTYNTQYKNRGEIAYRARLGFFASREEAEKMLQSLKSRYPKAWTTRVTKREKHKVLVGEIRSIPVTIQTVKN
jgi:hypothetical protein